MRFVHKHAVPENNLLANVRIIALIFSVGVLGFVAMYMSVYIFPISGSRLNYAFCTLAVTVLGLAVPYWMIKLGFHEAHLRNPEEKELKLEDIPKDQGELESESRRKE